MVTALLLIVLKLLYLVLNLRLTQCQKDPVNPSNAEFYNGLGYQREFCDREILMHLVQKSPIIHLRVLLPLTWFNHTSKFQGTYPRKADNVPALLGISLERVSKITFCMFLYHQIQGKTEVEHLYKSPLRTEIQLFPYQMKINLIITKLANDRVKYLRFLLKSRFWAIRTIIIMA